MQCILHRETIPLHASFTLLFVFIPASISQTWLKCSSYQRLCWTAEKNVRWEEKWSGKVKSIFYSVTLFILHRRQGKKRTQTLKLFFPPPCSLCLLSILLSNWKPPDTWGQTRRITSSIASPEQHLRLFLSQSIDTIPGALFSPITLCCVAVWLISAAPWLGLRDECHGLGKRCRAPYYLPSGEFLTSQKSETKCNIWHYK